MRVVRLPQPGTSEVTELPGPAPSPGEVIVAAAARGDHGTDLHIDDAGSAPGDGSMVQLVAR
jgi:threonine dehydrogenase-like Zn-dependent dehydrogenase